MMLGLLRGKLGTGKSDPASGITEEFAAFLRLDQSKWDKLIKENKFAVQ
jgi:hypothetical protein